MRRRLPILIAALLLIGSLASPAGAATAPPRPFGHACSAQHGVRFCPTATLDQRVPTFDGVPLDVDVTLPAHGSGPFPTIVMLNPFGGSKLTWEATSPAGDGEGTYHYNNIYYARRGYAVVNYSARGWGNSCGLKPSRTPPECDRGWWHMADQRFEVRDAQLLIGKLVDQGIVDPRAIGVTGASWGAGQSIQLAWLRDRMRLRDGRLVRWRSPHGRKLSIAAAYGHYGWTELGLALVPNGAFVDFRRPRNALSSHPIGVENQSFLEGFIALSAFTGFIAPEGADPTVDPLAWKALLDRGEPYGAKMRRVLAQLRRFSGVRELSGTPAPLLLQQGWVDDLFAPSQALWAYNALRRRDPDAYIALQFADVGHSRDAPDKRRANRGLNEQASRFFDAKLRGRGRAPASGSVLAYTMTCPLTRQDGGPFRARDWAAIHPRRIRLDSDGRTRTVTSSGGSKQIGLQFNPNFGGPGEPCNTIAAQRSPGTASYTMPVRRAFTLLGLPTIRARISTRGRFGQLVARLWDVSGGQQRLISRTVRRLRPNQRGRITFQLRGNGYRFARGHRLKLELVGSDNGSELGYLRPSNGSFTIAVRDLSLSLPVAGHARRDRGDRRKRDRERGHRRHARHRHGPPRFTG